MMATSGLCALAGARATATGTSRRVRSRTRTGGMRATRFSPAILETLSLWDLELRTYDPLMEKKKKYDNPRSDKDKIIFNEGLINWDSSVYLVEGTFEMLSFPVNTIPMLGKTISTTLYMKLKEMKPDVVVLLDPDAYKSSIELYYKLHTLYVDCEERVRIVKLPTTYDLDNMRKKDGIDEVLKSLRSARYLTIEDYFINKLQKPYDRKGYGRRDANSKYFEWKPSSGGTIF